MTGDFFYIMNMLKEMTPIEIARYINDEVGMDIADIEDGDVKIIADRDFLGNEIYFHDYLFSGDAIYSYINQDKFVCGKPYFCTNSFPLREKDSDTFPGCKCFNPDGMHNYYCEFDPDIGLRKFDEEILKNSIEGLKNALKVPEQRSKLIITDEVEFMDI